MSNLLMPTESELRRIVGPRSPKLRVSPYLRSFKHLFERLLASAMLLVAVPVLAVLMCLVSLTSWGWPLFSQIRVGKHGRYFRIYKLRTMRHDAEKFSGAVFSTKRDPRITWLGRILRKTHLDEIPQLFNVAAGDMSFVGPRPERPEFVAVLSKGIDHYADRLQVLPGVTGLAAINLPPDDGLTSAKKKQVLDVEYIQTASFTLDMRMLLATSLRLVGVSGERAMTMMNIKRTVTLDEEEQRCELTTPDAIQVQLESHLDQDREESVTDTVDMAVGTDTVEMDGFDDDFYQDDDASILIDFEAPDPRRAASDSQIGAM